MEGVAYTIERHGRVKIRIDNSVPHERSVVPTVASQRVHFNPLSLPAGIQNFTYSSLINEEIASGPLRANGRPDENAGSGAMRQSLFGSQHVHSPRTECGSSSVIGAQPLRHGAYGSGNLLRL